MFKTPVTKSQIGVVILDVNHSNPNGNVEDNSPRTLPSGHGWISSMSFKRRCVREMLEDHSSPEFKEFAKNVNADPDNLHIFESNKRGFGQDISDLDAKNKAVDMFAKDPKAALARYYDTSLFGCTMLESNAEVKENKKEQFRFLRTGCVTVSHLVSMKRIDLVDGTIIKHVPLENDHLAGYEVKGKETLQVTNSAIGNGAIKVVQHGIYVGFYRIAPGLADKTNTTQEHIEVFKKLIPLSYRFAPSTARADVSVLAAFHATHGDALGTFPEHKFREACTPTIKNGYDPSMPSTSYREYNIPTINDIVDVMDNWEITVEDLMESVVKLSSKASKKAEAVAG